jgi:hypothetical protein
MLVIVAFLAAGCGGKSAAPSVANLTNAGTTTTTTTPSARSNGSIPRNAGFGGGNVAIQMSPQNGAKYSACMRKNGVPNFPDPNAQGEIAIGPSSGVDPGSPKFQSATQTCRKLLPNGGKPSPAQIAKAQQAALNFSKCMRAHGLPDFPDPTFSTGGGIGIKIQATGGLNPNDPAFQKAQQACRGRLPFPKGAPSTSVGPK